MTKRFDKRFNSFGNDSHPSSQIVTIAINTSESTTVNLNDGYRQLVALQMPSGWTTASLTFLVSADGSVFVPLHYAGSEYTIVANGGAAASRGVSLDPNAFLGWNHVKVRSGTAAAAVPQVAERKIMAITRSV
jgi:hypothetical protein